LSEETQSTDSVVADLTRFRAILDESPDLQRLVESPTFLPKEQVEAVEAVMQKAGISGLAAQFIGLVAANRRLNKLPEMLEWFNHEAVVSKGTVFADATFAADASEEAVRNVVSVLKDITGKDVSLTTHTDPELIGGIVVKIGSRMVDASIRTKLNSLRHSLKEIH
jgi:F-type H+-transporting ATPase subunit delta